MLKNEASTIQAVVNKRKNADSFFAPLRMTKTL